MGLSAGQNCMRQVAAFFGRAIAVTNRWDEAAAYPAVDPDAAPVDDVLDADGNVVEPEPTIPYASQGWYWAEDASCQRYAPPAYDASGSAWASARDVPGGVAAMRSWYDASDPATEVALADLADAPTYADLRCRDEGAPGTQFRQYTGADTSVSLGALQVGLAYPDAWWSAPEAAAAARACAYSSSGRAHAYNYCSSELREYSAAASWRPGHWAAEV